MMICSGKCSFFIEATNSLTVVVLTVMYPIIIPGTNRIKKPQIATTRKLGRPDRWGAPIVAIYSCRHIKQNR